MNWLGLPALVGLVIAICVLAPAFRRHNRGAHPMR